MSLLRICCVDNKTRVHCTIILVPLSEKRLIMVGSSFEYHLSRLICLDEISNKSVVCKIYCANLQLSTTLFGIFADVLCPSCLVFVNSKTSHRNRIPMSCLQKLKLLSFTICSHSPYVFCCNCTIWCLWNFPQIFQSFYSWSHL